MWIVGTVIVALQEKPVKLEGNAQLAVVSLMILRICRAVATALELAVGTCWVWF